MFIFISKCLYAMIYVQQYPHMAPTTEKRLFNRYDQYEIASFFTETAEEYLSSKLKASYRRFLIKTLLGIVLFVNGYLSHWGPWPWPSNYYLILSSVFIFHIGSLLYEWVCGVKAGDSNLVGDYFFGSEVKGVSVRIGEDKLNYYLQVLKSNGKFTERLPHTEYFTIEGFFLEQKFKAVLERFVERVKKGGQQ